MSWRKSWFSYLVWFVYAVAAGGALAVLSAARCAEAGVGAYWGILAAVLYMAVSGGIVFLLGHLSAMETARTERNRVLWLVVEAALVVLFLALGFYLRVRGMDGAEQASEYYDAAKVVAGQGIPQISHGAHYLYLQALNGVFLLVGNYFSAGVWFQVILQMAGAVFLFFAVRKLAGAGAALSALGFCMCAPYMIRISLALSPEMLYFVILALAAALTAAGCGRRLQPVVFLFTGALAAVCAYLDVMGILLLPLGWSMAFCLREEAAEVKTKAAAIALSVAGAVLTACGCILADSLWSGKAFQSVAGAWIRLYAPEHFRLPVAVGGADSGMEGLVLFCLLALGIFSFWRDRGRDRIALCVAYVCVVMLGSCYGIFTEEMPGFYCLYLLFAILAGIGIEQCVQAVPAGARRSAVREQPGGMPGTERLMAAEDPDVQKEKELQKEFRQEREDGQENFRQAKESQEQAVSAQDQEKSAAGGKKTNYIDNPLPLPKKHEKKVMDYTLQNIPEDDDFDYSVAEDDDFDV